MATIFDMSSGKIESEITAVTSVTDYSFTREPGLALQQVCDFAEEPGEVVAARAHIIALLKEL